MLWSIIYIHRKASAWLHHQWVFTKPNSLFVLHSLLCGMDFSFLTFIYIKFVCKPKRIEFPLKTYMRVHYIHTPNRAQLLLEHWCEVFRIIYSRSTSCYQIIDIDNFCRKRWIKGGCFYSFQIVCQAYE